uniref:Uncharacterized protein n=1 Tax=Mycena chlorophos TaxID=658473 RepID=A0ABQ0M4T7_MYCCL|nr:predicted protein [Mycena chlorophos]
MDLVFSSSSFIFFRGRRPVRSTTTEKYVSKAEHDALRSEHDALRARVDALESYLQRIPGPGPAAMFSPAPSPASVMSPLPTPSGLPAYAAPHRLPPLAGPGLPPIPIDPHRPIHPRPRSGASSPGDLRRHASSPIIDMRRQQQPEPSATTSARAQRPSRRSSQQPPRNNPQQPPYPSPYAPPHIPSLPRQQQQSQQPLTTSEPLASNARWVSSTENAGGSTSSRGQSRGAGPSGGDTSGGRAAGAPGDALDYRESSHQAPSVPASAAPGTVRFVSISLDLDDPETDLDTTMPVELGDGPMVVASISRATRLRRWPYNGKCLVGPEPAETTIGLVRHHHKLISGCIVVAHRKHSGYQPRQSTHTPVHTHLPPGPNVPVMVIVWGPGCRWLVCYQPSWPWWCCPRPQPPPA